MKKSGFRALIGLVVVVIVVILVYQNSGKNTAESGISALQAIVETGEYASCLSTSVPFSARISPVDMSTTSSASVCPAIRFLK